LTFLKLINLWLMESISILFFVIFFIYWKIILNFITFLKIYYIY